MPVDVVVRSTPRKKVRTWVEHVGAQVEPVPPHQLHDPRVLEWGLPVRIAIPPGLSLRPGELVVVTFRRHEDKTLQRVESPTDSFENNLTPQISGG